MKRLFIFAIAIAVLLVFGLIIWLHPGSVDLRYSLDDAIHPPLGLLLVFTFLAGVIVTLLLTTLQQLQRHIGGWQERRKSRRALRIGEWHQSGAALHWDGDLERSRSLLRKAWRRQPHSSAAALALASSHMETGEHAAAKQVLQTAVTHDTSDPDLRYALANALRGNGDTAEALRMLDTVRVQ